ncbi:AGAP000032-PA-like protein [Anopheles sinensis]|uniref:AGAP000032-PA-like protein n=1 Tax=Anopheles sinensis TaxID=74873 RepID=A0A084VA88_ANOSI|nr:AGAP000032-PA-like protein [Anopheles sinensis]
MTSPLLSPGGRCSAIVLPLNFRSPSLVCVAVASVIVGAPTANTTQPDVIEGGAVYRCDIYDDHRCYLVPFDTKGNNFNEQNEQIDTKSNQWFGATVASAGVDGPLVACAPRYVFHQLQPRKAERVEPVGTCHIAKNNMREFQEYSPCRTGQCFGLDEVRTTEVHRTRR